MVNAYIGISRLISRHINKDAIDWVIINYFFYNLKEYFLFVRRIDRHNIHVVVNESFTRRRKVEPIRILPENTFVCTAEIKTRNNLNTIVMTFLNNSAQHVFFHEWICILI